MRLNEKKESDIPSIDILPLLIDFKSFAMKSNQHYLSPNRILWRFCFFAISWTTETIAIYNLIRSFRAKISNFKG